jgi:hypothetical protein
MASRPLLADWRHETAKPFGTQLEKKNWIRTAQSSRPCYTHVVCLEKSVGFGHNVLFHLRCIPRMPGPFSTSSPNPFLLIRSSDNTDSFQQIESSTFWNALVAMDGQTKSSIHLSIDSPLWDQRLGSSFLERDGVGACCCNDCLWGIV